MKLVSYIAIGAAMIGMVMFVRTNIAESNSHNANPKPLASVRLPELSDIGALGQVHFQELCSSCHGSNAEGNDGFGPPLIHKIYEPSHHSDYASFIAPFHGVRAHHWPFGNMPPIDGISEEKSAQILTFIREVQRENGIS